MKYLLTGTQMKQADKYTIEKIGIPSMVLMERAALEVVKIIEEEQVDCSNILVVCGTGNNGGDGYAIARLMHLKGYAVTIWSVGNENKRSKENESQYKIAKHYDIPIKQNIKNDRYSLIIDAVFGIGLSRNIEGKIKTVIETMNQLPGFKVSVDIPSGISDDTGKELGIAFKADLTVALAYAKKGELIVSSHPKVGKLRIADIGIYVDNIPYKEPLSFCYDFKDFCERYPKRAENSHKGTYGKVLLIVGSKGMSGAAYLCAKAAYMVGCGLVRIYTHEENREIIQKTLPEAMVSTYDSYDYIQLEELLQWADVVGIGCGLGVSETAKKILHQVLQCEDIPCVIDADAINMIAKDERFLQPTKQKRIFTPHMKEMSRLLNSSMSDLQEQKFEQVQMFCEKQQAVCVLKDARTIVHQKGENFFLNLTGNSAMAKGGSGDVLTGIISGILAQNENVYESACLGVYLHGMAGDLAAKKQGKYSLLASDIVEYIGEILMQI